MMLWGVLFASLTYCSGLMYMLSSGVMATVFAAFSVFWGLILLWYVIDCIPARRISRTARKKVRR